MALTLTILDMAGGDVPFAGAAVYVWHCDAAGGYSMYSDGITEETYLRGVQVAGDDGTVSFTSVFPACYSGRWPHIHFEVYPTVDDITDATKAVATSQAALPEDACTAVYALPEYAGSTANLAQVALDSDNVFGDDGGELQLGTVTGDATAGYRVTLTARVDTATTPTAGSAPSGGGGGGMGGPGGTRRAATARAVPHRPLRSRDGRARAHPARAGDARGDRPSAGGGRLRLRRIREVHARPGAHRGAARLGPPARRRLPRPVPLAPPLPRLGRRRPAPARGGGAGSAALRPRGRVPPL